MGVDNLCSVVAGVAPRAIQPLTDCSGGHELVVVLAGLLKVQMANDVIAREGSLGREMFFLVNGNVDVTAMISPLMTRSKTKRQAALTGTRKVGVLYSGNMFGRVCEARVWGWVLRRVRGPPSCTLGHGRCVRRRHGRTVWSLDWTWGPGTLV